MRNVNLENLYENLSIKRELTNNYKNLTEDQVDQLLESNISPMQEEVIEELFGKTRAKMAGAAANLGARATNLKNQVATGAQNVGAKVGAYTQNAKNLAQQGKNALQGQYQTGDLAQGQVDPSQVGNNVAPQVDPNQAANAAKLNSILPQLTDMIKNTYTQINSDLNALGLDTNTLQQLNPDLGKAITNGLSWLKYANNQIVKTQNNQNQG